MVKKLTLFVLASMLAVAFVACEDDKPKDGGSEDPEVVVFPNASGVLDEASATVALTFSVTDALNVDPVGPVVSLLLPATGASVEKGTLILAAGTYDIVSHAHNFFRPAEGKQIEIQSGSVKVARIAGNTRFEGSLKGTDGTTTFDFMFEGVISGRIVEQKQEVKMTAAAVHYDNRLTESGKYVYSILLTDGNGEELSVELVSAVSDFFKHIPAGTYTLSGEADQVGTILKTDNSYRLSNGVKSPLSEASVTLTTVSGGYSVLGTAKAADGKTLEFTYDGPLSVSKATLELRGYSELGADGQNYGLTYNDYTLWVSPDEEDASTVGFVMYITGPLDVYYRYLPIPKGTFTVFKEYFPLKPWSIPINDDVMDSTGFTFYDAGGGETFYRIAEGSIEITTSEMKDEIYTIGFGGKLTAVNAEDQSDVIDFNVTYKYSMPYWDGYYFSWTAHPFSTLKQDVSFDNFTLAVYDDFGYGYWSMEGGPEDTAYTQITLMPQGGAYGEWLDEETANPNNRYISIGLHLTKMASELGGIPVGTYKMDKNWQFTPGTFMPGGILVVSNKPLGLYLYNGTMSYQAPFGCGPNEDGGEVKITKAGEIYTITITGYDDLWPAAHKITASYTGKITSADELRAPAVRRSDAPHSRLQKSARQRNFEQR